MIGNKIFKSCIDTNSEFIQTNIYTNVNEISVILIKQSLYDSLTSLLEYCTCPVT